MTESKSRLEDLPNELLTDIFKNLDARDLFRALQNLNSRLNQLIQSFQYLQLVLHIHQSNPLKSNGEIFFSYVHTLIVDPWININLNQFPHIHRLRLDRPLPQVLEQLKPNILPDLEDLSVTYMFNMYEMDLLRDRIFSNAFPRLQSCELFDEKNLMTIHNWTQSPSITILKIQLINSLTYKSIRSACPNLNFLKFWIFSFNEMPSDMPVHTNLKRMVIECRELNGFTHDNEMLNGFLTGIPNLERLEIHRGISSHEIEEHDYFASLIQFHLPLLRKFQLIFHLSDDQQGAGSVDDHLRIQMQRQFDHSHRGPYQAELKMQWE